MRTYKVYTIGEWRKKKCEKCPIRRKPGTDYGCPATNESVATCEALTRFHHHDEILKDLPHGGQASWGLG